MDPVALIMAALAAGASPVVPCKPREANDPSQVLREVVRQRLAGHTEGELALARYEADPRAGYAQLAAALAEARAGDDAGLAAVALAVMELAGVREGKYRVVVSGSQGVQIGDHNTQVSYFIGEGAGLPGSTGVAWPAWRPLAEVTDPFSLEVHRPVQAANRSAELPILPVYVPREHDLRLREVVRAAAAGASGIAVLVGGSSTGKTRACWEALGLLRDRPEGWRLWHPLDPSRPEAALRDLSSVEPRTVIWLNEAQLYLGGAAGGLGERVAAGLRELLRDPGRAPLLVLATLWPQHWRTLTTRTEPDVHAQSRELLSGYIVDVPDRFTKAELSRLRGVAGTDSRLAAAVKAADRKVIQYLAGVPVLLQHYRHAPLPARALIDAAIDARRLGCGVDLPLALLADAVSNAGGYLSTQEWNKLGDNWLDEALAYAARECNGVPGPLTRNRPRPAVNHPESVAPRYRLMDYLQQAGTQERRDVIPPSAFWAAVGRHADTADLSALAAAAHDRGLLRASAQLAKHATDHDAEAASLLVRDLHRCCPGDDRPARWAASCAPLNDALAVSGLLAALDQTGAGEQVAALIARNPAAHVSLDDPVGLMNLLWGLDHAGASKQIAVLAARDPASKVSFTLLHHLGFLLGALHNTGAEEQAAALAADLR